MDARSKTQISKFLSLVLRHRPDVIGIEVGDDGWVSVDKLLERCAARGKVITREMLDEVVATN